MDQLAHSQLLVDSLLGSPLLVNKLGQFDCFDRSLLSAVQLTQPLNFEQKLGHLYEDALRLVIDNSKKCELIASNLQVFRLRGEGPARDTLGELDYMLKAGPPSHQTIHLELAVKFYLSVKSLDGNCSWPGPDARDNWDRKRLRLQDHQLKIGRIPEAQEMLELEHGVSDFNTEHLIYGCLFDHFNDEAQPAHSVACDATRGFWLKRSEWQEFQQWLQQRNGSNKQQNIWSVPKHLWPVTPSVRLLESLTTTSRQGMMELSSDRCAMFTDGVDRFFLVSDHWTDLVGIER